VLEVDVTESGGATLVSARGDLDIATVARLRRVLEEQTGAVVLDLRDLEFMAAEGLHLLVAAEARARVDGLDLILVPGAVAERLLRLTGLRERFRVRAGQM
jgi:anti-anti-sigma factor